MKRWTTWIILAALAAIFAACSISGDDDDKGDDDSGDDDDTPGVELTGEWWCSMTNAGAWHDAEQTTTFPGCIIYGVGMTCPDQERDGFFKVEPAAVNLSNGVLTMQRGEQLTRCYRAD
jgi:hypothetical protein